MSLISAIDTYYQYVAQQLQTLNAQVFVNGQTVAQPLAGIINAQDWPQTPPVEGGLYLIVMNILPAGGTKAQRYFEYFCQWTWLLIGTDIADGQVGSNRGDRYRASLQIMENLRQANYPGYCRRTDVACDPSTGALSAVPTATNYPYNVIEMVTWSELRFIPKEDRQQTGLTYGAASVELYAYSDVAESVA